MEFAIPPHFEDLLEREKGYYAVEDHSDLARSSSSVVVEKLEDLGALLGGDVWEINSPAAFDVLYHLILRFPVLDDGVKGLVVNVLVGSAQKFAVLFKADAESPESDVFSTSSRSAIKMYVFLMAMLVTVVEKDGGGAGSASFTKAKKKKGKKGQPSWSWSSSVPFLVAALSAIISDVPPPMYSRLWNMDLPEEEFLMAISRALFTLYESPATLRSMSDATTELVHGIFRSLVSSYSRSLAISTSITHLLHNYDHLPSHLASLLAAIATPISNKVGRNEEADNTEAGNTEADNTEADNTKADNTEADNNDEDATASSSSSSIVFNPAGRALVEDILQDIGRTPAVQLAKDTVGTKNMAAFIIEMAEAEPKLVLNSMAVLIHHLDGEAYVMRNAIISALGSCVAGPLKGDGQSSKHGATRDSFLDHLMERLYDVTSYTRSRTLQTWSKIVEARALPLSRLQDLVDATVGRLHDKASIVRRMGLSLLRDLLAYNPFAGNLNLGVFEAKREALSARVAELTAIVCPAAPEAPAGPEPQTEAEMAAAIQAAVQAAEVAARAQAARDEDTGLEAAREELEEVTLELDFVEAAIQFTRGIAQAIPLVTSLLASKTVMDTLQAIEFLTTTLSFGVEQGKAGVKKVLGLIWSKEESVRAAVIDAYRSLYFAPGNKTLAASATVASHLVDLTLGGSPAELTSLEELVRQMRVDGSLPPQVDAVLWELFSGSVTGVQIEQQLAAVQVLCMIAKADPNAVASKVDVLVRHGLGASARVKPLLAAYTAEALRALAAVDASAKIPPGHKLLKQLRLILLDAPLCDSRINGEWYPAAEQVVSTLFALAENPEVEVQALVSALAAPLVGPGAQGVGQVDAEHLSRVFFVVGQSAVKALVYMEELERVAEKDALKSGMMGRMDDVDSDSGDGLDDASPEEAVARAEILEQLRETSIVNKNLLGSFGPLLVHVCLHRSKYASPRLQANALLALTKFMVISRAFCEANLRLLFSILNDKGNVPSIIRANLVVAVGDLAFRFPNEVEPWTAHIYARLRDESILVRQNTLMVLSHLILNDMIKVKGQIAEIGLSLLDPIKTISDMAHMFFHELSRKANKIYNILPDMISQLSSPEASQLLGETGFNKIMTYLFTFIDKEKQREAILVKLCERIGGTTDKANAQNLGYCLSLLPYSSRLLMKLMEHHKAYHDKLFDPEFESSFRAIATKAKRSAKDMLPRFEGLITALLSNETDVDALIKGMSPEALADLEEQAKAAKAAKAKARKDKAKAARAQARKKKARAGDDDDDDFEFEGGVGAKVAASGSGSGRERRTRRNLGEVNE